MLPLGRLYDIGTGWLPVDLDTANGATGKRIALPHASSILFVVSVGVAASGTDDLVLDVQQHTAYTSGTSADLDAAAVSTSRGITQFWVKSETALDNDESWVRTTQSEASEVTLAGATYAATQQQVAIWVDSTQLGDTYTHVSLNAAITTAAVRLSSCIYILSDLNVQRSPQNMGNLLRPGAANA